MVAQCSQVQHGGISVVLAETLGSCGAVSTGDARPPGGRLDIDAHHLRSATAGRVAVTARPVHIGRTTNVWQIDLVNWPGQLTCVSRITMAMLAPR